MFFQVVTYIFSNKHYLVGSITVTLTSKIIGRHLLDRRKEDGTAQADLDPASFSLCKETGNIWDDDNPTQKEMSATREVYKAPGKVPPPG